MSKEEYIIVYSRVSSAAQSLSMQISLAKQYLERENIDSSEVQFIDDHDVSATKLSMYDRKGLNKLIKQIKADKAHKVIVYKRDRLARNFYEYSELAKLFINYNLEVIFTASDEPPFSNNLALESFYGIFAQMEGNSIKSRTDDVRKQYPSNIFGYIRNKNEGLVTYTANPEKADVVRSLFEKAASITSAEMFIDFLIEKHPFKFEQKIKVLTNSFYAGYFQKNELFQKLSHVEPLTDLSSFKKVNSIIDTYLKDFNNALNLTPTLMYKLPKCDYCKNTMKVKRQHPLDSGQIYCSNGHKKVEISIVEYNQQISLTLHEELLKFKHSHLRKIAVNTLKGEKVALEQQLKQLKNNYQNALLDLTSSFDSVDARYDKSLATLDLLKNSISITLDEITMIDNLIEEIKTLTDYLNSFNLTLSTEDLINIATLLVEDIHVGHDFTSITLFLTATENGVT
ncbi:hypothetical protein DCE79_16725 [Lysinibacillus sp. 2017]|uniref:recombinase family protein n=1 Tax=unclassified Lysinibacillus TaxID=2636778 RepID=UPI000D529367|nr:MULTISPECIES: recombinase family protein [unclassified Lysinibacillus]AWE08888.1 hypothetical protein DCE79_16725 [Lysinibacillus sp. 2017]TGN34728.1 recombinase family protein [Lysinibacillus sp. S2017]